MEKNIETAVIPDRAFKVICDPRLAKFLLNHGETVVSIKPKRDCPRETVFIFKNTERFSEIVNTYVSQKKQKEEAAHNEQ